MLVNSANLSKLYTGFKATFSNAFQEAPVTYDRVSMPVPSSTRQETYGWLGQFPGLREWIGDRVIQNLSAHDYVIRNRDFELTIGVDRNDIEDDTFGIYSPMFAEMGRGAKSHPDQLVYSLLKSGFSTACYDGQYFFDTDHPDNAGNSLSNVQAGPGPYWFLLDVSRAVKPIIWQKRKDYTFQNMVSPEDEQVFTRKQFRYGVEARVNAGFGLWQLAFGSGQALSAANYAAARQSMMGLKGDEGRPLGITPGLLVVPPQLEADARGILLAERDASGATNIWRGSAELLITPYLA